MTVHQLGDARVLIAGGSRGIGLAIATAFARHGARLGLCARGIDGLQRARDTLQAGGAQVHVQACDLADPAQIQAWVEAAATALGGIDIVVNNASGFGHGNDDASWQAGFDIDLMAAVRTNRLALPYLRRSAIPAILNVSSINARVPTPRASASASMPSPPAPSFFPAGCGTSGAPPSRRCTQASATGFRSVASATLPTWRRPRCSCARPPPAGSPGRYWR